MMSKPQKEHEWLQQLVGDWTMESEADMGPGQPKVKSTGTERVRSLGGMWVIGEGQGEMPGGAGTAQMIITLGFDPKRNRYVGTWIGSMMHHLWLYDGELDAAKRVLTLNSDGPSFAGDGTMAKYQDIIEIVSTDHRILRSQVLGADGKWTQFMEAHYRRVAR
jgi:hypothetical protein